jgi:uncharacterized membrane protein YukC
MSSIPCSTTSKSCHLHRSYDVWRFILVGLLPFIVLVLCLLSIFLYINRKHRNRIDLEQHPTVQQNDYDIHSSEPPPYNWHSESPPPPPYTSK